MAKITNLTTQELADITAIVADENSKLPQGATPWTVASYGQARIDDLFKQYHDRAMELSGAGKDTLRAKIANATDAQLQQIKTILNGA